MRGLLGMTRRLVYPVLDSNFNLLISPSHQSHAGTSDKI